MTDEYAAQIVDVLNKLLAVMKDQNQILLTIANQKQGSAIPTMPLPRRPGS